jgi:hypothetical protein
MDMKYTKLLATTAVATLMAGGALASPVTITSVSGIWENVQLPSTVGLTFIPVTDPNEIRWGNPATTGTPPENQSGYRFDPVDVPVPLGDVNLGNSPVSFDLGDFTHFNLPIFASESPPSSIESADLRVAYSFLVDAVPVMFEAVYRFLHLETDNAADPCADGGTDGEGVNVNGCADRVTVINAPDQTQSVRVGDLIYTFDIFGFDVEGGGNVFWTTEEDTNVAGLAGRVSVAPIPLPAPALLLLFGLGGLVGLRRFRSAA